VAFDFSMTVKRIYEDPRVTKPYTEEQWAEIAALGHEVDARLKSGDVRLTMGGEPTFVSVDDMEGAEWNTEALGAKKRELSGQLIKRLRGRFAEGGLLHYGQGKWYPGKSLPRWTLGCYWRKDGHPVWSDVGLIADDEDFHGHDEGMARRFVEALIAKLDSEVGRVRAEHVLPAYEDAFYYLWKERRLPVNVDPFKSRLREKEDRERLAKVFEQGLDKVVGFAVPLRPVGAPGSGLWESGRWFFRSERMYLIRGDSPMGLRLPLDSLPWAVKGEAEQVVPRDVWEVGVAEPAAEGASGAGAADEVFASGGDACAGGLAGAAGGGRGRGAGGCGADAGGTGVGIVDCADGVVRGGAEGDAARVHAADAVCGGLFRAGGAAGGDGGGVGDADRGGGVYAAARSAGERAEGDA
jgi:uncharacterized protein (DUF2126 family)